MFQRIADLIEIRIQSGEFVQGERIPSERALAMEYGVSRITVHEAILSLQARGMLSSGSRSRARVRVPGAGDIADQLSGAVRALVGTRSGVENLQDARAMFECGLARYAARHATPRQLAKLTVALEENRRAVADPKQFIQTDMAFHLAIAEMPGNPLFVGLHQAFGLWLAGQREKGLQVRGSVRKVMRDHEAIHQAIMTRDVEAADHAMTEHLAKVAQFYWRADRLP